MRVASGITSSQQLLKVGVYQTESQVPLAAVDISPFTSQQLGEMLVEAVKTPTEVSCNDNV